MSNDSYEGYEFYKDDKNDKIWWVDNYDVVGEYLFSFDKKRVFNLLFLSIKIDRLSIDIKK